MPDGRLDEPLRIVVSPNLRSYLGWLADNTILGKTDNEVARYLLTKVLENMRQSGYREEELPLD
jgi:hypothetical protein